ncbi:hypothetical protein T484DRAFT_1871252 [Baffinella frigidus]|nr:hypothetical protein T484DRAFT_1871252 [Cryptophyta sp. CCMP2293]
MTRESIHRRGGTILGSSRGGHDLDKIMEKLIEEGVNQIMEKLIEEGVYQATTHS